jgi:hypothetical protein
VGEAFLPAKAGNLLERPPKVNREIATPESVDTPL